MQNTLDKMRKVFRKSRKSILKIFHKQTISVYAQTFVSIIISESYALAREKGWLRSIFLNIIGPNWFRFWLAKHIVMNWK